MELGSSLFWSVGSWLLLTVGILYFGYRLSVRKKQAKPVQTLSYDEARRLARNLLKKRYMGRRGFIKPYVTEFSFPHSGETLRKALQETNPTPNVHYVQQVLNDLAPGQYRIAPTEQDNNQEVA